MLASIAFALVFLVLFGGLPSHTESVAVFNNAGHAPIFGALAWIILALLGRTQPDHRSRGWHWIAAFVIATLIGIAVELIQAVIGRDAEVGDVMMDASGAAFTLSVLRIFQRRREPGARAERWVLVVVMCVAVGVVVAPLIRTARAYVERHAAFPELARFDRVLGVYFFRVHSLTLERVRLPKPWAQSDNEPALKFEVIHTDIPGTMLVEPWPDWRGHRLLRFDIVNPEDSPLELILRIHDRWHNQESDDRFNRGYVIEAHTRGTIDVSLDDIANAPRGRKLDLANVAGVGLFQPTRDAVKGEVFYIAHIRLE